MSLMLLSNPGLHLALLGNPKRRGGRGRSKKSAHGFGSRKLFAQARRRAIARVGRTYKTRGGGRYKVFSSGSTGYHRVGRPKIHAAGVPWSGRKGGIRFTGAVKRAGTSRYHLTRWTNPRRSPRKHHMRRNPLGDIVTNAKAIPTAVKDTFTGPNKVKSIAFAAGAGLASFSLGGMVLQFLKTNTMVPAAVRTGLTGEANSMKVRVISAVTPLALGLIASAFIKNKNIKTAIIAGSAIAAAVEMAKPGMVGDAIAMITGGAKKAAEGAGVPSVANAITKVEQVAQSHGMLGAYVDAPGYSGAAGLAGYVDAPGYAGAGAYIDAPGYSGAGDLAAYVDAPGYAGAGDLASDALASDDLAGPEDSLADDTVLAGLGTYLNDSVAAQSSSYLN